MSLWHYVIDTPLRGQRPSDAADRRFGQVQSKDAEQDVGRLREEMRRLRICLDAERAAVGEYKAAAHRATRDAEAARDQLERERRRKYRYRDRRNALRTEVTSLKQELEESKAMIRNMRGRLQDHEAVRERLEKAGRNIRRQQFALDALQRKHGQTLALLEERTADLRDAQLYLTKTDSVSDAEVLAMVELINSQIFQSAAQILDSVDFESAAPHHAPLSVADAKERTSLLVGETLLGLLEIVQHRHDSFALQLTLQATLVACSRIIVATWAFGPDSGNTSLEQIYVHMKHNESQTVSGRWRNLARRHARAVLSGDDVITAYLLKCITTHIADVFAVSGLQLQGSEEAARTFIGDIHGERLKSLIEGCLQLRRLIGEEVISGDFEVIVAAPGEKFNEAHTINEYADPKADTHTPIERRVLCTTAMGLYRVVHLESTDAEHAQRSTVLLKPTVALETLSSEIFRLGVAE